MILEQLTLVNFCLYKGEHTFNMAPRQQDGAPAPIVLVGGINGGGKTTLLNAIQLVLYGRRAACATRSNKAYEEFLRSCIHRGSHPSDWASVALTFRYASEGQEHVYRVRRTWAERNQRIREKLYVSKDGRLDRWLADHWNELVEELIPLGISQLFFFDAEQIRFIAEDEHLNRKLGGAIKSLLGIDLAERLIADAAVLEARLAARIHYHMDQRELEELAIALKSKEAAIRAKKAERAALENELLRARNALHMVEDRFAQLGGHHWELRQSREARLAQLKRQEQEVTRQLVNLAASELPLTLVISLLERVKQQDTLERRAKEATIIQQVLEERDKEIIELLKSEKVSHDIVNLLQRLQYLDRAKRAPRTEIPMRLMLSISGQTLLDHLLNHGLSRILHEARSLLERLGTIGRERETIERSLKATPEESEVRHIAEQLKLASTELGVLSDHAARMDAEIKSLEFQRDEVERELQKLRRRCVEREIECEEAARMAKLAVRTQAVMHDFLRRATRAKIGRLSQLVTESFRFLVHKKTLVERLEIDPDTFSITLYDNEGKNVPQQQLSEGEKQLFAISVLWGLARASSRPLPAIIDTPMARLDAEHRNRLISRYFPNASHQVVILSTDTEVDQKYYRRLQPYIARAYHLTYSEVEKVTVAKEGYFWT